MSHPLHKEINEHFINIYRGESRMLPPWDLILESIQLAKIEGGFDNTRYVTWVYHALEDLLQIVKNSWITYEVIDEEECSITLVKHDIFTNKFGIIDSEPTVYKPDPLHWKGLYSGKSLEELNKNPASYQTNKFDYEIFEVKNLPPLSGDELLHAFFNNKSIQEEYKVAFQPVYDPRLARNSFERFIERITHKEQISPWADRNTIINRMGNSKALLDWPIIFDDMFAGAPELAYQKILDAIYFLGIGLEQKPKLFILDEEGFRDYLIAPLNYISKSYNTTGETFNKKGRTDIMIQNTKTEIVFLAECKLWKGEGEVYKALDQLFSGYVTWRETKLAIIFFNKNVKGFSNIIETAIKVMQQHRLFKAYKGISKKSRAAFIFMHPEDELVEVELELMLLNCYIVKD